MIGGHDQLFQRRYIAVKNAMIRAKNPKFKELWKNIMDELIKNETARKD